MRFPICLTIFLSACGPDVTAWKGTWAGTAVINAGRQPEAYPGTLVISDGARFEGTGTAGGTTFTCAINAATADATTVTFTVPGACDLVAAPADGCTRKVTVNAASATRSADAIEGSVSGRVNTTCAAGGGSATDFLMTLSGVRR